MLVQSQLFRPTLLDQGFDFGMIEVQFRCLVIVFSWNIDYLQCAVNIAASEIQVSCYGVYSHRYDSLMTCAYAEEGLQIFLHL